MIKKYQLLLASVLLSGFISAQKVGLVLSGGGAKGITHIGVIKALEENNIPIDYIAGTSMGAIVGSMYAMGYTIDEMIEILKSEDFKHWSTGTIESKYIYYYRNVDPKPSIIEIKFRINHSDSTRVKSEIFPSNIVSPHQMNYAFMQLFAKATAASDGDFDKLFVPFRCVAADIYKKEAVIFRKGDLGDAVRASMSYPFMFKPIVVDGRLLFDGGIYNNFPVDVMRDDFKPDFIIGSTVAKNPKKPGENNIVEQITNMVMSKTDYTIPKEDGMVLHFDLEGVRTFDFSNVDELVKLGYDSTVAHIAEIKSRVARQAFADDVTEKRFAFRRTFPELKFQNVTIQGVDSLQKIYIEHVLHENCKDFNIDEFKEAYFDLISDDKISEVIPHATLNKKTGLFDLNLNVKIEPNLKLKIGGNISSSISNQAYVGLMYQNLTKFAQTAYVDAQFGRIYNGLGLGTRIDIPTTKNWYVKLALVFHKFNYFDAIQLFYADDRVANFSQTEGYGKLSVGFPLTMKGRMEFGAGFGALTDSYEDENLVTPSMNNDKSIYYIGSLFTRAETYTLNSPMYPTLGYNHSISLQLLGGDENFKPAAYPNQNVTNRTDLWVNGHLISDRYFRLSHKLTLGTYGEVVVSTRDFLQNYSATIIQSPAFRPTPHSRTVFNEAYSANQFAAVGLKPIYNITDQFHLRGEMYCFVPYKSIYRKDDNSAAYLRPFTSSHFIAETSAVFNFKTASIGAFVNYYSSSASRWNFGLNIGFLLFNNKFLE